MSEVPFPPGVPRTSDCVLTIGNFDGVHRGHAAILKQLCRMATQLQLPPVVVTFDPPPLAVLAPDRLPPRLTSVDQKVSLLLEQGISEVIVWPATPELLSLSADQFFEDIVLGQLRCRGIVEGPNFCFGRGRAGTVERLQQLGSHHRITVAIAQASESGGSMISSSEIRNALSQGNVVQARELLGRPYQLTGTVITGAQRGRQLGYPTANLGNVETLIPPQGVYAGRTTLDGKSWPVALNIGPNPTFAEDQQKIEAYLIGFSGNLYGKTLSIELLQSLRGVKKFSGVDELKWQLQQDVAACRAIYDSDHAH